MDQFLECFKLPSLVHDFWFNSAFSVNEHCSFHSQKSCFRKLQALENLGSAARAALPVWDCSCDSAGTLSCPLVLAPAVFLQNGLLPPPFVHLVNACPLFRVALLLPSSPPHLSPPCFLHQALSFSLRSTRSLPLLSHSKHSCSCLLPGQTELFAVSLVLSTPVLRKWGLMSAGVLLIGDSGRPHCLFPWFLETSYHASAL